jgi:spore germination cell wall hydrolase CwlJ-like protein
MNPYDLVLCWLTIWREARGESLQAQNGVYHVILNRVAQAPRNGWPHTIHGVCTQAWQFSSFNKGTDASVTWPTETHSQDWQAWLNIQTLTSSTLLADPTNGATFYCDDSIVPPYLAWLGPTATLADLMAKHTVDIGRLRFFAL